eukprot:TRINITY_DN299_c0_g1_i1.p2 TRINITY_DN299_c0_g1~~TRINITY_DN299_c0_g1_i1.p2  ORF type:complete len:353 (+),score=95.63 TRINITY_DN299_c0_g1_i1:3094-4152(+)
MHNIQQQHQRDHLKIMETKHQVDLPEKEYSQVRADKERFLTKLDKLLKSKDKSEEVILKDLYACFVEKAKTRLQKSRDTQNHIKRIDILVADKVSALSALEKHKKNVGILAGLNSTLEKQNVELQEEYKKTISKHQEQRKEINESMQAEIKAVQEEMEQEVHRKQILAKENEALAERIKEMKEMLNATNENVEKTLGKSEFDVDKLEEQLKSRIEAETTKIVNEEREKTKQQNEELQKSVARKSKALEEYAKQFEEYKEKIGKINSEVTGYKTELEEKAKKIMDVYEENKVVEEKINKTKNIIGDLKKQIDKAFKEKEILNNLKHTLQAQVKGKEPSQDDKPANPQCVNAIV